MRRPYHASTPAAAAAAAVDATAAPFLHHRLPKGLHWIALEQVISKGSSPGCRRCSCIQVCSHFTCACPTPQTQACRAMYVQLCLLCALIVIEVKKMIV